MKSVVIVEDDPDIQSLIATIFSMDPRFSVVGLAESAEEAVEIARTNEPEIIVLDDRLAGDAHNPRLGVEAKAAAGWAAHDAHVLFELHSARAGGGLLEAAQKLRDDAFPRYNACVPIRLAGLHAVIIISQHAA